MHKLFTFLLMLMGWGLGEALAPVYYGDHPETWFFIRVFLASALSGLFWFSTEEQRANTR
jgi:hypothetical protein